MKTVVLVNAIGNAARIARDVAIAVACLIYVQPAHDESAAYRGEHDGQVWVAIDGREIGFAPNVARAIAADLVDGANTLESAE